VLVHRHGNWQRISVAAAVCYRWDGQRARLYFDLRPGSYNDQGLIEFLRNVRRHFRGQRVLLLWDGLAAHRSRAMHDYLASQAHWLLQVERLPAYAPELNPVEGLWANLKGTELANRCDLQINQTIDAAQSGGAHPLQPATAVWLSWADRSLFLTSVSLYYANLFS
jgi:hypothetical protein